MNKKLLTLCALLGMTAATTAGAAGTSAGTDIVNTAYLESLKDDGTPDTAVPSNPVTLTVQHVPSLSITPDGTSAVPGQIVYGQPGSQAVLTYTLTNTSNAPDTFTLGLTAGQQASAGNAVIYRESDGVPGLSGSDTVVPLGSGIALAEDASVVFYVAYNVSVSAPSSDVYDLTPTGVSAATLGGVPASDINNLGRIQTRDVYAISFVGQNNSGTTTSPGTVSYSHELTNTGNTPLGPSDINLTVGTIPGDWTYSYSVGGAAPASTPEQALINWGGTLAPGGVLEIVVTVSAPNGLPQGTTDITSVAVSLTPAPSAEVDNTSTAPQQATDTTRIIKGVGMVTKNAQSCGMSALCMSPVALNDGDLVKPGEYLRYTVVATNMGDAGLKRSVVSDTLPMNTLGVSYSASMTGTVGGQLLYRITAPVTAANPTPTPTAWSNVAPSIAGLEGTKVDVGYDADSDGDVDAADQLPAGADITLILNVQVK